jgi:hypothetical protein
MIFWRIVLRREADFWLVGSRLSEIDAPGRVASHGNALVHEIDTGTPEVTVFYVESDRLTLIHCCDYGNRPHMVARPSPDGRTVGFDLADYSGSNEIGHVSHGVFTIIDAGHHLEDWTFMLPGDKPVNAHIDLKRVQ